MLINFNTGLISPQHNMNFCLWVSLQGLLMLDLPWPPIDLSGKKSRMCLQSHLQTSPPTLKNSYA